MSNLTISFVAKFINQTVAPLKGLVSDLTKVGKTAGATVNPLKDVAKATDDMVKPAEEATKAQDKLDDGIKKTGIGVKAFVKLKLPDFLRSIGSTAKIAVLGITSIAAVATSAVIAGTSYVSSQAKAAEQISKSAKSAGVGTTSYQRLAYAFQGADLDAAALDHSLNSLNIKMTAAGAKSKMALVPFKSMGIAVRDSNGHYKSADALLGEVANKFATYKDGARKATLAQMLFGESGATMIPLLSKGSAGLKEAGDQAQKLGLVLSEEVLKQSEELNNKWQGLTNSVGGLRNSIWTGLLPSVIKLVDGLQGILDANKDDILAGIKSGVNWLVINLPTIIADGKKFLGWLKDTATGTASFVKAIGGVNTVLDALGVLLIGKMAFGLAGAIVQIWGLNAALFGCPVVWIIAGVTAIAVAAFLIIRHWDKVKVWLLNFWNWMKKNMSWVPVIGPLIQLADMVISHWSEVTAFFTNLGDTIGKVFKSITNVWNSLPEGVRKFLGGAALMALPGGAGLGAAYMASGESRSLRSQGMTSRQSMSGSLGIHVSSDGQPKVTQMSSTPNFSLAVDRGLQGGF